MLKRLQQLLTNLHVPYPNASVEEMLTYCFTAKGKKIRPQLVILSAAVFGASLEEALDPAIAIECIHLYSCIHDDLPCMDDDDWRRGVPSLHKVYGEAEALLAGDALLTFAFSILAKCSLPSEIKIELIQILAQKAGAKGMIAGQLFDIRSNNTPLEEKHLLYMHEQKTGALFSASTLFGAVIGAATKKQKTAMEQFGSYLGIAYQIKDDLLDVIGSEKEMGKPVGSDAKNAKSTSASLYGIEAAEKKAKLWYDAAIDSLEKASEAPFPQSTEKEISAEAINSLKELVHKLVDRTT